MKRDKDMNKEKDGNLDKQNVQKNDIKTKVLNDGDDDNKMKNVCDDTNKVNKPGIDSPEFLAYFEKFMMENSSFYALKDDEEMNESDHSGISSMEYESNEDI